MIYRARHIEDGLCMLAAQVTLMFADIVGFTSICKQVPPDVVMTFLNDLYREFDDLVTIFNVYKVGSDDIPERLVQRV